MRTEKIIVRTICVWLSLVILIVASSSDFLHEKGQQSYFTIYSHVADDPEQLKKHDALAPKVCNYMNNQFESEYKDTWDPPEPTIMKVTYTGQGHYDIDFSARGRGISSLIDYLLGKHFKTSYDKIASENKIKTIEGNCSSGGSGYDYLGPTGRTIAIITFVATIALLLMVNRLFKKIEIANNQT